MFITPVLRPLGHILSISSSRYTDILLFHGTARDSSSECAEIALAALIGDRSVASYHEGNPRSAVTTLLELSTRLLSGLATISEY